MVATHEMDLMTCIIISVIRLRQRLFVPFDERFTWAWLCDEARGWNVHWALEADNDLLATHKRRLGLGQTASNKMVVPTRKGCVQALCRR
jgi:hypothetical protein